MLRRQKHKVESHIRGGLSLMEENRAKYKEKKKALLGDGHNIHRKEHFFISVLMRPDKVDK